MSTDKVHPLVHNAEEGIIDSRDEFPCEWGKDHISVAVFGDRVASSISLYKSRPSEPITMGGMPPVFVRSFVEIQNWQENHGHACTVHADYAMTGVQFLDAERLLVMVGLGYIDVYDIKDLCQVPTRLAMFELPGGNLSIVSSTVSHDSPSCAGHASTGNQWIWTTNKMDRLICVKTRFLPRFIVISPRAFDAHMTPLFMDSDPVAWEMWGPTNCRSFVLHKRHHLFAVGGMRFAWSSPISNAQGTSIRLHVADFNPSVVARGAGRVIRDSVTTRAFSKDAVTTSLPYVEVVSSHVYPLGRISRIMLDEERLLLFTSSCFLWAILLSLIFGNLRTPGNLIRIHRFMNNLMYAGVTIANWVKSAPGSRYSAVSWLEGPHFCVLLRRIFHYKHIIICESMGTLSNTYGMYDPLRCEVMGALGDTYGVYNPFNSELMCGSGDTYAVYKPFPGPYHPDYLSQNWARHSVVTTWSEDREPGNTCGADNPFS
ncbi:hypothetical protein F4604DRAFT_1686908 [Suillus subluteus]|nr:hypothetical protein F4604DRAFT_1686908 [Suillus subluteus]